MNDQDKPALPQPEFQTTDIYSEAAVWLCQNLQTGFKTRINGVLAQVLKKYPKDYRLKLLKHQARKEATDG